MPKMQYGLSAFERGRGDLPQLPVVNYFVEEAPSEEEQVVLQSRPGLSDRLANMGTGAVDALFKRDSVLGGTLYGVADGKLYSGTTEVGAINGGQAISIAGFENTLFVTAGDTLYTYDGTTMAAVSFPDSASTAKVVVGASRAIIIREDTGKFYWTDPLDDDVEALDFATAEDTPDRLLDMVYIDGVLVLFGAETVEVWQTTQSSTLPFAPLRGAVMERGIRATGCAAIMDATFFWVGDNDTVYTKGAEPVRISNSGLEEKIAASTDCSLWSFKLEGAEYLALRLDTQTYIYSSRYGTWTEFASYGETNWLPQCYADGVFGSSKNGKTLEFGTDHSDLGGVLERRFRAGFPLNGGGVDVDNVGLRCNVGQTPFLTGQYADPEIEMRVSDDAGQTWGNYDVESLGEQGEYRTKVQWRALGQASQPGFLCEFRLTDPVPLRISSVLINEPYGGR